MTAPFTGPEPDHQHLRDLQIHLTMLFGYCEGFVAVRMLRETGTGDAKPQSRYLPVDSGLYDSLRDLVGPAARDQRGLYVVPCTVRAPGSAKAGDIFETCAIPVDLDKGNVEAKRKHLEHHLGLATEVVTSGGRTPEGQAKLHLYWRLTEACSGAELEKVVEIRQLMIAAVDADASFQKLTQPIRVPGSIHGKNGVRTWVAIETSTGWEYDLDEMLEDARRMPRMPGLPPHIDTGKPWGTGPTVEELQKSRVRAGYEDDLSRYEALSKVIGHWVRLARLGQCSVEEAWAAVVDYNQACIVPPWPSERLKREFDALLGLDQRNHRADWDQRQASDEETGDENKGGAEAARAEPPAGSEDALAGSFVEEFGPQWRYVAPWGKWLHWDGRTWSTDETQSVVHQIRGVVRKETVGLKPRDAQKLATNRTFRAVERIASSDRRIASRPSDWDAHDALLNTPSGVIDLQTGEILPHDPSLLLTQATGASPGGQCPTWMRFIDEITGGDAALAAYLARICGYCLTGDTGEQVFFFFHGAGANGKSVFLQTVSRTLGSYAATAPLDSFMIGRGTSHPTDIAGLRGKRLVTVSETEPGRAWAESRIKTITGGDPIRARFLYQDFFEFVPTFKLIVAGNHRPQLTGVGEAMRRRLHLVPFDITIPPDRRDKQLAHRLETELGGVLSWMIAGYHEWQQKGLDAPQRILEASRSYFADEDLVGQWIDEELDIGEDHTATAKALFASWGAWAEANGTDRGSQKTLGEALRSRGFENGRSRAGWFWRGLAVRSRRQGSDA
ncbi:phage/plasmid primase, P4 family [Maliponia aquimaris]|uniref:SF3 helicase domain-containing protein n=1 Tax=Maliponia aquimaris TaxID=1673631 RepID=A0A238K3W3_9RHOB|nr:phage/plasmid primase, P4 family [Maliponia aquimaris]SMX37443.1 hypothetical protein MAA8898_01146 [Maliponia aquimaris]